MTTPPFGRSPFESARYSVFISHAWTYSADYDRLVSLIDQGLGPYGWKNLSVDKDRPLPGGTSIALSTQLQQMIQPAQVVLIIGGMYVHHRDWIQHEIDLAKHYAKPIIGVEPYGSERVPTELQVAANEMVGWRSESVCDAIRRRS